MPPLLLVVGAVGATGQLPIAFFIGLEYVLGLSADLHGPAAVLGRQGLLALQPPCTLERRIRTSYRFVEKELAPAERQTPSLPVTVMARLFLMMWSVTSSSGS